MLCHWHIPRTGGTTLIHILRRSFGPRHCDVLVWPSRYRNRLFCRKDLSRLRTIYWRLDSIRGHRVRPYSDLDDRRLRGYTFVRDPQARCLSHFARRDNFAEWIRQPQIRNLQTQFLAGEENADAAIEILERRVEFVGLTERYDESLVMFQAWAQHDDLDIRYGRPLNAGRPRKKRSPILDDPALAEMLADANREDQKLYDYICDHVYPRQQEQYGPQLEADVERFQKENVLPAPRWKHRLGKWKRDLVFRPLRPLLCRGAEFPSRAA